VNITINDILEQICTKGSLYDEIMDTILESRDSKSALISEISNYWLQSPDNVVKAYNEGYFKYYFIRTVKNQIHSNTSAYHKNHRINERVTFGVNIGTDNDSNEGCYHESLILSEDEDDIINKILLEDKMERIEETMKNCNIKWIEEQLFREYFYENKTYRQIEEEYGIDHVSAWKIVKAGVQKIKNNI